MNPNTAEMSLPGLDRDDWRWGTADGGDCGHRHRSMTSALICYVRARRTRDDIERAVLIRGGETVHDLNRYGIPQCTDELRHDAAHAGLASDMR